MSSIERDTHLCLVCNERIDGIDSYIKHKTDDNCSQTESSSHRELKEVAYFKSTQEGELDFLLSLGLTRLKSPISSGAVEAEAFTPLALNDVVKTDEIVNTNVSSYHEIADAFLASFGLARVERKKAEDGKDIRQGTNDDIPNFLDSIDLGAEKVYENFDGEIFNQVETEVLDDPKQFNSPTLVGVRKGTKNISRCSRKPTISQQPIYSKNDAMLDHIYAAETNIPKTTNGTTAVNSKLETTQSDYHCASCRKTYHKKANFQRHLMTAFHKRYAAKHHFAEPVSAPESVTSQRYQCRICSEGFCELAQLHDHLKSQSHAQRCDRLIGPIYCQICKFQTAERKEFVTHLESESHGQLCSLSKHCIVKEKRSNIKCNVCDKRFHHASELSKHNRSNHHKVSVNDVIKCYLCRLVCSNGKALQSHLLKDHNSPAFCCEMCDRTFHEYSSLQRHLGSRFHSNKLAEEERLDAARIGGIHIRNQPISDELAARDLLHNCVGCGQEFGSENRMKLHQVRRGCGPSLPSFSCEICHKVFATVGQRNSHDSNHHKTLMCTVRGCGFKTTHKRHLSNHMTSHSTKKPLQCTECPFKTSTQQCLKRHMKRVHLKERPHACEYCDYKASESGHLRRHMRVHIGAKAYRCPYCDYRSETATNIRKHIIHRKIHPGKMVYSCVEEPCGFETNEARSYTQHLVECHAYSLLHASDVTRDHLYSKSDDAQRLPEGECALPVRRTSRH